MYCLFCDVLYIVCLYMCTEQLPPGGYPIAVKYIVSYHMHPVNLYGLLTTENLGRYYPCFFGICKMW